MDSRAWHGDHLTPNTQILIDTNCMHDFVGPNALPRADAS